MSVKMMSLIVAALGVTSFIFGVIAENKKVRIRNLHKQSYHLGNCLICTVDICAFETVNSKN